MRSRPVILFTALSVLTVGLFLLDLAVGAVRIPVGDVWAALTGGDCPRTTAKIVLNIRLIKAVVALLAGAALSVSGLQMQTLFRNPLAGPYVLGISSGASLGVALVVLAGVGSSIGIAGAAWLGAAVVLLVIAAVGHRIKDIMVILILGMMFSSGVSAVVQILQYLSKEEALKAFVIWTMGSLGDVTVPQLAILLPSVIVGLLLAVWTIKPLNLLLFGEEYAVTMGLNIRRSRGLLFLSTTLLAGTVTAFCGPIGHRSCHASRRADALPRGRPPRAPAGNPSLGGGGIASLRYRFQNVHFARKCHYRTAGNPDSRMGGFTQ